MKRQAIICIVVVAAALCAAAALALLRTGEQQTAREPDILRRAAELVPHLSMNAMFYDRGNFLTAQALSAEAKSASDVHAVLVPHHLLASRFIADALARSKGGKYKTIVIIGPNHDDRGPDIVSVGNVAYDAPSRAVYPDQEKVSDLRNLFACRSDASVFSPEHSIGAMIPFLAADFPEAKIVPIILSSQAGSAEAEKLSAWLTRQGDDTLVVFSTDFSHYLMQREAEENDKQTRAALEAGDAATIGRWGNEHVDSPFTVVTMLKYAEKIGARLEIVDHANANDFLSVLVSSTTSYFEIIVK